MSGWRLHPLSFRELPGWEADAQEEAVEPLGRCAHRIAEAGPYRTGTLGVRSEDFRAAFSALESLDRADRRACRAFFETHFVPARIDPAGNGPGFVTGFYEPDLEVARRPSADYRYPIHARPDDLMKLTTADAPDLVAAGLAFGRRTPAGPVEYFDRAAIEAGALDGRGLEIAWARDRVDLFFVHIQGAARLRFPDGSAGRITYAGKSGHPFTAIGRVLIGLGEIDPAAVTMESLRRWLAENPRRHDEILHRNRSFIFFRETPGGAGLPGPVAAAKVPLAAGRSLAVDRLIHTFGTPFFVTAPTLEGFGEAGEAGFARLMVAQDTGSAIVGPARGDLFAGSGAEAGAIAGGVRHAAVFHVLLPLPAAERLLR